MRTPMSDVARTALGASWIEWAWLAVAVIAWMIKTFLTASARAEYRQSKKHGNSVQVFMARSVYYHMCHMMVAFTICVAAAVWAVVHQPPPPPIHETQSFMVVMFFIVLNLVLLAHAIKVAQWWNKLEDGYYNGHANGHDEHPKSVVTVATTVTSDKAAVVKEPTVSRNDTQAHS